MIRPDDGGMAARHRPCEHIVDPVAFAERVQIHDAAGIARNRNVAANAANAGEAQLEDLRKSVGRFIHGGPILNGNGFPTHVQPIAYAPYGVSVA